MGNKEILVPEILAVIFLAIPLMEPFLNRNKQKTFLPQDGLFLLPFIAFAIITGIFPAYGFRPECILILIFSFALCIINLFSLFFKKNSYRTAGSKTVFSSATLVLLIAASLPMFIFYPRAERTDPAVNNTQSITLYDRSNNNEYFLRIYGAVQTDKPVIFIVPPEIGSALSIDLICSNLQENNFTVVTYFRKGFDTPAPNKKGRIRPVFLPKLLSNWRILNKAGRLASVNEKGKKLEEERRTDIEFLLNELFSNNGVFSSKPPVLLVGYGAGGSALSYMAAESGFVYRHNYVTGAALIESRFWSLYSRKPAIIHLVSERSGFFTRAWAGTKNFFSNLGPKHVELLPVNKNQNPQYQRQIPILYVVSGRAVLTDRENSAGIKKNRYSRYQYQAVKNSFQSGTGPSAFTAIEGAGIFDYQDFPLTHPVCSFIFPGKKTAQKSKNPINDTAGIINNYASMLLEQYDDDKIKIPPRLEIQGRMYVESKGIAGFGL